MNQRKDLSPNPDRGAAQETKEPSQAAREKQAREAGAVEYDSWTESFRRGASHG